MLRRTGVALATVMLVLPLTVVAQKGGRSRSSLSRSLSEKHSIEINHQFDETAEVLNSEEINPSPDADTESVSGLSFRVRFRRSASQTD